MTRKKAKPSARQKELKLINQFMRRSEKRGIIFPEELKQEIRKIKSWQRLRSLRKDNYKKFLSDPSVKVISGVDIERYKKGKETPGETVTRLFRERKPELAGVKEYIKELAEIAKIPEPVAEDTNEPEYVPPKPEITPENARNFSAAFEEGKLIYDEILLNIEKLAAKGATECANMIRNALSQSIESFGFSETMESIEKVDRSRLDEVLKEIYDADNSDDANTAGFDLLTLIQGYLPTEAENKAINEANAV